MNEGPVERRPWDRRPRESTASHERFRTFRDLGPSRTLERAAAAAGSTLRAMRDLSAKWDWAARATAWDDECRMIEDAERLETIRNMHRNHQIAGRAAFTVATRALAQLQPSDLNPGEVVRLLDLGYRLERAGLTAAEEQAGIDVPGEDPWEQIARELSGRLT